MSPQIQQNPLVCQFCMLQDKEHDISRIAWSDWQDSPLAAMYESVMKQPLFHSKELFVCYCNKCAELLCQTVHALSMFQRADTYWRNIFVDSPGTSSDVRLVAVEPYAPTTGFLQPGPIDHTADIVVNYLDMTEKYGLKIKEMEEEFEDESVKTELVDGGYQVHLIDPIENENRHQDFWIPEDEDKPIVIEPPKCTENDSASDTIIGNENQTIKIQTKHQNMSKIVNNLETKIVRNDELPCVECNEIFRNRAFLNRHTEAAHNMIQCIRCKFTTATRQSMKRHELVEHKRSIDSISSCPKCSKVFTDMYRLRLHLKNTHAPLVSSQCHICSQIFKTGYRLMHHMKNVHVEAIFECDICQRKFRQKKNLKIHIMIVHVKEEKFICTSCGMKFTNQTSWRKHEAQPQCRKSQNRRKEIRTYNPNPIFSCSMCSMKFCDQHYGRVHYQKIHKVQDISGICLICNYLTSSTDALSEHLRENHPNLSCPVCKRFFKSQISLKSHIATHSTKERPFECKICNATFIRKIHLQDHHRRVHDGERPYKCTDCDQRFVTNCEKSCHWRHRHDPNRKHQCNWCEKKFASHTTLLLHETVHTGIGKYNCDLCGDNFRFNHQLVKHFQSEHRHHKIR